MTDASPGTKNIPFSQFIPFIKNESEVLSKVTELYKAAQHNKKIIKLLMERIAAANFALGLLRNDNLHTLTHYTNLQRLVQVIQKMKTYSEEIAQYNKLQKFLG